MSKVTQTPQEDGLLDQTTLPEIPVLPEPQAGTIQNRQHKQPKAGHESKVHQLSHGQEFYTPKNRERKTPALMTVDQYLRKAKQDKGISDLIRSLHKTKVMSFADWEREATALLKKKTW